MAVCALMAGLGAIGSTAVNALANERNIQFNAEQAQLNREFQQRMLLQNQEYNSAEAQKQRDWQTQMSNTAHQREVADLQAAGLNPVLAANAGANVASGAAASSSGVGGAQASYAGSLPSIAQQFSALMNMYDSMRNTAEKSRYNDSMLDMQRYKLELQQRRSQGKFLGYYIQNK